MLVSSSLIGKKIYLQLGLNLIYTKTQLMPLLDAKKKKKKKKLLLLLCS